jgi:DNA-binding response OmpR family regulator
MARILIVEDEPSIGLVLEDDLRREGYETVVLSDGEIAASKVVSERFDLILLDVMLPGKDGFEVCRDVRRAGITTPIILLTAKTQEAEKVLGLELGADDYVTKPYSARPVLSPDGRQMAFQAGTLVSEVWALDNLPVH